MHDLYANASFINLELPLSTFILTLIHNIKTLCFINFSVECADCQNTLWLKIITHRIIIDLIIIPVFWSENIFVYLFSFIDCNDS